MRSRVLVSSLALIGLMVPLAASAKTVVEFTDGRYLEVRAHEVLDRWVRLEVQRGSMMYVPARRIEMIERDRQEVYRSPEPVVAAAEPRTEQDRQPASRPGAGSSPRPRRSPTGR